MELKICLIPCQVCNLTQWAGVQVPVPVKFYFWVRVVGVDELQTIGQPPSVSGQI